MILYIERNIKTYILLLRERLSIISQWNQSLQD
nr:MAG TPA: hypothetical protein [Caudoviricetes sp.]